MTTSPGKPQRGRGLFDFRALILIAVSVAVGVVAVTSSNWLVLTAMVLSVAFQAVGIWLRWRKLSRRSPR